VVQDAARQRQMLHTRDALHEDHSPGSQPQYLPSAIPSSLLGRASSVVASLRSPPSSSAVSILHTLSIVRCSGCPRGARCPCDGDAVEGNEQRDAKGGGRGLTRRRNAAKQIGMHVPGPLHSTCGSRAAPHME
jgi:hypothetical protein